MDQEERNRVRRMLRSPFRWILEDDDIVRRCPMIGQGNLPLYMVALIRDHIITRHAQLDDGETARKMIGICETCENFRRCSEPEVYWKAAKRGAKALNKFRMKMERRDGEKRRRSP